VSELVEDKSPESLLLLDRSIELALYPWHLSFTALLNDFSSSALLNDFSSSSIGSETSETIMSGICLSYELFPNDFFDS
jgi:hypothetical protein